MPRITSTHAKGSFRATVNHRTLAAWKAALEAASAAGLTVDYQPDVEQLLRRLTKSILDAVTEQARQQHAPVADSSPLPDSSTSWNNGSGLA